MDSVELKHGRSGSKSDIFPPDVFVYDKKRDMFHCPAGEQLKKKSFKKNRNHYEYAGSPEICNNCKLKNQCTRAKKGRMVSRHLRQDDLDKMLKEASSKTSRKYKETSIPDGKIFCKKCTLWIQKSKMAIIMESSNTGAVNFSNTKYFNLNTKSG